MTFINNLLPLATFDTIYIVVDQLTKMAYFILYKKVIFREETIRFFLDNIYINIMAYLMITCLIEDLNLYQSFKNLFSRY